MHLRHTQKAVICRQNLERHHGRLDARGYQRLRSLYKAPPVLFAAIYLFQTLLEDGQEKRPCSDNHTL